MSDLPQDIDLNLDTVELKRPEKPFKFVLEGRVIELRHPKDLDWTEVLDIDEPIHFLRYVFKSTEDKEFFKAQRFPIEKLDVLMERYMKHYGLEKRGNGAASRL